MGVTRLGSQEGSRRHGRAVNLESELLQPGAVCPPCCALHTACLLPLIIIKKKEKAIKLIRSEHTDLSEI